MMHRNYLLLLSRWMLVFVLICIPISISWVPPIKDNSYKPSVSEVLSSSSPVIHPNTIFKTTDLSNFQKNLASPLSEATYNDLVASAKWRTSFFTTEKISLFIPNTTPGTSTFCPHCHATGKNWHANGDWSWDYKDPDKIKCNVCGMTFPNSDYPESIKIQSNWDPNQVFSYVNNGPVTCMEYEVCRSSMEGVIRGKKLHHIIKNNYYISHGYLASRNATYAAKVKEILMELGKRIPKYLVYAGYSYAEYCDVDPHIAVRDIDKVNQFIFAPGNENKTGLYHFYWAASRLGTSGMDGSISTLLAEAFDFTADAKWENGTNVYSESDKAFIIKNVIIESSLLGYYDNNINNKAIGNREAAAMAGLATGSKILTQFGLEGFLTTVNDYYLKDGGGPESVKYNFMVIEEIYKFGYAFRNYSDDNYTNLNVNTDTLFGQVFYDLVTTACGNFYYPAIADSYTTTIFDTKYIDILRLGYKNSKTIMSFADELSENITIPTIYGLFFDDITTQKSKEKYNMPDIVFPYLSQGFIRSGKYNRKSLLVLDASNYGNHHHMDSLNIFYWKDNRELLHDLGYLWDHVNKTQTQHTKVHNTAVIDGEDQIKTDRNGSFHLFATYGNVKVMQASSNAYKNSTIYNRTIVQIEHASSGNTYLVDIFRVNGGFKRRKYAFHGVNNNYTISPSLVFNKGYEEIKFKGCVKLSIYSTTNTGYFIITDVQFRIKNPDGSFEPNLMGPIPSLEEGLCNDNTTYCAYKGNGNYKWNITTGPNGQRAIYFEANEASVSNGVNKYNVALMLGNTKGYTADKTFTLSYDRMYYLEYLIKGTFTPSPSILYWEPGDEFNKTARQTLYNFKKESGKNGINANEWTKVSGTFTIGNGGDVSLGAVTSQMVKIKWDIDDSYSFSSFTPKKTNQEIYFENGWGQRDYKNSDKGVTIPYFYIHRSVDEQISTFVNVFEGNYKGKEIVQSVEIDDKENGSVGIKVVTKEGTDYILSTFNDNQISSFNRTTNSKLSVEIEDDRKDNFSSPICFEGTYYKNNNEEIGDITSSKLLSGKILNIFNDNKNGNSWFTINAINYALNIDKDNWQAIILNNGDNFRRAYPIKKIEKDGYNLKIYTKVNFDGININDEINWELSVIKLNNINHLTSYGSNSKKIENYKSEGLLLLIALILAVIVIWTLAVIGIIIFIQKKKANTVDSSIKDDKDSEKETFFAIN